MCVIERILFEYIFFVRVGMSDFREEQVEKQGLNWKRYQAFYGLKCYNLRTTETSLHENLKDQQVVYVAI